MSICVRCVLTLKEFPPLAQAPVRQQVVAAIEAIFDELS